ncbi:MAG: S-layer homology domain-containing protein [Bacillota bacterium]|nr:S-layer homology domain-containing protein [Bacillota bacterium]
MKFNFAKMFLPILASILSLILIFNSLAGLLFSDVDSSTEGGKSIYTMAEAGIVAGYGDGTFGPNNMLTRAQFVKIVNKVFKYTVQVENKFTDVSQNAWYYKDIEIAQSMGYIKGFGDGSFHPDDLLTKEQVCVILNNIMNFEMLPMEINITDKVSDWAKDSVKKLISNRLLSLSSGGAFGALKNITREEVCIIMAKFVMAEIPDIGSLDIDQLEREELMAKMERISKAIRNDLISRTDNENIKSLFLEIAVNMENYMKDSSYDYKSKANETKANYYGLTTDEKKEAKRLITEFFTDPKYIDDLEVLYDFFF